MKRFNETFKSLITAEARKETGTSTTFLIFVDLFTISAHMLHLLTEGCSVRGSSALALFSEWTSYLVFYECDVIGSSTEQMCGRGVIRDVIQH